MCSVQCTVCHKQMGVLGVMTEDKSPVVPQSANVSRFMLLPGSGLRKVLLGSCSRYPKRAHPCWQVVLLHERQVLRTAYYRTKYEFLLYYDDGRQRVICRFLPGTLFVCFRLLQHITEVALTKQLFLVGFV